MGEEGVKGQGGRGWGKDHTRRKSGWERGSAVKAMEQAVKACRRKGCKGT